MQYGNKTVVLDLDDSKFVAELLEVFSDLLENPGTADEYLRMLGNKARTRETVLAKCRDLIPNFQEALPISM